MPDAPTSPTNWFSPETVKSLGFPVLVSCALMWLGSNEIEKASARFDKMVDFATGQMIESSEKSSAALQACAGALNNNNVCVTNNTAAMNAMNETLKDHALLRHSATIPPVAASDDDGT